MRIDEIELSAAKNTRLPEYLTAVEMCLYTALSALYKSYHKHDISMETAKVEKQRIISKCKQYEDERVAMIAAYKYYQDNSRRAGTLLSDIEKSTTAYDIALKACEAIGCMTGDVSFFKRQKNKMEEQNAKR